MIKKYYSEKLDRYFDSEDQCMAAEIEYDKKVKEQEDLRAKRADRAREIEDAYKHYLELRDKFVADYGSYHLSITSHDVPALRNNFSIADFFDTFWL